MVEATQAVVEETGDGGGDISGCGGDTGGGGGDIGDDGDDRR